MSNAQVLSNPIIENLLQILRNKNTTQMQFLSSMEELGKLCAYEIAKDLPTIDSSIETPLVELHGDDGISKVKVLDINSLGLICLLRAAIPFVNGFIKTLGDVTTAFVSAKRADQTDLEFSIEVKYEKGLQLMQDKIVIIPDPMLATASSAKTIIKLLLEKVTPKKIIFCSAIASEYGVDELKETYPDITIYSAAVDKKLNKGLNEHGYIVPGLGDAGDRAFGTTK